MVTNKRPTSISVISWYLVAGGIITIIWLPFAFNMSVTREMIQQWGISLTVVLWLNVLSATMNTTAGMAMLRQFKWGRQLYVTGTPVILGLSLSLYHFKFAVFFIFGIVMFAAFTTLLNRPAANDYFERIQRDVPEPVGTIPPPPGSQSHTGRQIVSVLLMAAGGFFLMTWVSVLLPLSDNLPALLAVGAFSLSLASVFIVPAIFLWGRKRWSVLLGVLFASVGGLLFIASLMVTYIMSMPEFKYQFARVDPSVMNQFLRGWLFSGLGSVALGTLLILRQRQSDKMERTVPPTAGEA